MRISTKFLTVAAVAGLIVAGGTASTASNTLAGDNVAGYGTATVSGATTTGIEHTLSADGTTIVSTLLTFSTDIAAHHAVTAGFGTTALEACVEDITANTATCAYTATYTTSAATDFRVAVS